MAIVGKASQEQFHRPMPTALYGRREFRRAVLIVDFDRIQGSGFRRALKPNIDDPMEYLPDYVSPNAALS